MNLTVEQVLALAPDASSATAGKQLANGRGWTGLGRSADALWGQCQGSALYQVQVALADLTVKCSCPSRKFPCKHGLGLLLMAAASPATLAQAEPPAWVGDWLARRATAATAPRRDKQATSPDEAAQRKRGDRRAKMVAEGLDGLDLWLDDLIRQGLAGIELRAATFWEAPAKRLVDAQAPGLAARVRKLAGIPNATPDWPQKLLAELGRLALLSHAYRRLDALDPLLQEDVRQAIGWNLGQDEVIGRGETVADDWFVAGQSVRQEERLRVQRTWLLGARQARWALVLQFAAAGAPFESVLVPGTRLQAALVYWPSAYPLRALVRERTGQPSPIRCSLPHAIPIAQFLDQAAQALARQPWLDLLPCALRQAVPLRDGEGHWWLRDQTGGALPMTNDEHWLLLAFSGGHPLDVVGEWDGAVVRPLATLVDGQYHILDGAG